MKCIMQQPEQVLRCIAILPDMLLMYYVQESLCGIQRCCQFLHYLPDAKMTTETKLAMEGEVQFIRAFCYFNLVQNYGRVPLVTEASLELIVLLQSRQRRLIYTIL